MIGQIPCLGTSGKVFYLCNLEISLGLNNLLSKFCHKDLHVGIIAEDVPELVANNDREGIVAMDIVAVLTKVVQEQQELIQEEQVNMKELKAQNDALMARIEALENEE